MASGDRSVVYVNGGERFPAADSTTRYEIEHIYGHDGRRSVKWLRGYEIFPPEPGRTYIVEDIHPAYTYTEIHDLWEKPLDFILTDAGKSLLDNFVAGDTLTLNKVKLGSGTSAIDKTATDIETPLDPVVEFDDVYGKVTSHFWGNWNTGAERYPNPIQQFRRTAYPRCNVERLIEILVNDTSDREYSVHEVGVFAGDTLFCIYRSTDVIWQKVPMRHLFVCQTSLTTDRDVAYMDRLPHTLYNHLLSYPDSILFPKEFYINDMIWDARDLVDDVVYGFYYRGPTNYFSHVKQALGHPHEHRSVLVRPHPNQNVYGDWQRLSLREVVQSVVLVGADYYIDRIGPKDIPAGTIIGSATAGEDYIMVVPGGSPIRLSLREL